MSTEPSAVRLEAWGPGDLRLLEGLVGDPAMMAHLGGAESPEKIRERQRRYETAETGVFKIVDAASARGVGFVGFWPREWRGEVVYEIGWSVVPSAQGRGIAAAATELAIEAARADGRYRYLHAYPNIENAPSNAICRKLGFELLEALEFEYPKGHFMMCNDWRLRLDR